ncbi:hypothetical protein BBF96_10620 [Anoxybacter fermentans]|uniref:Putative regulatory protein FmdB zinc ribbon domain-containing protein n=1 Tax=Anoxybacter fermentans TaxID=1323375 RepID=A0A3S9SZQ6_9FIRM|nr:zinc ribbon domain-containing protein [Anoxybacter fermentans]AZR73798.1 hypothetical protein BBF96_10620 [Anoxybacter fermentans]
MPIYDFICTDCQHQFSVRISYAEKKNLVCPECKSTNLKEDYSGYGTSLSFKSTKTSNVHRPFT